jgi:hypothetical protein
MGAFTLHMGKMVKHASGLRAVGAHNARKEGYESLSNPDMDPKRTYLNGALVPFPEGKTLDQVVDERIQAGYKGKKALRKDAVKCLEFVVSADKAFMDGGQGMAYLWKSLNWMQTRFGKENVVGAFVHQDEATPHLHVHVVPLTPEGKLSAKELTGGDGIVGRRKLQDMRSNFHINVAEGYGLDRGEVYDLGRQPPGWEDKDKKHKPTKEGKKNMAKVKELAVQADEDWRDLLKQKLKKKGFFEGENITLSKKEVEKLLDGYEVNKDDIDEFKGRLEEKINTLTKSATKSADELHEAREKVETLEKQVRRSDGELNHVKNEKYKLEAENKDLKKDKGTLQEKLDRVEKIGQKYEEKYPGFFDKWQGVKDELNKSKQKSAGVDFSR